jgi:phosphoenolpyruvate phosphomutase
MNHGIANPNGSRSPGLTPTSQWMGVYDQMTSILSAQAGVDGLWLSGYCVSAAVKGRPDVSCLDASEMIRITQQLATRVPTTPVFVDCDTGFGDDQIFEYVVEEFCATTTAAGLSVEDKIFPKRNSFYHDAAQELVSVEEFEEKLLRAVRARDARRRPLKLIARTEALIAGEGVAEAVRRARRYVAAGADAVMVQARGEVGQLTAVAEQWHDRTVPLICSPSSFPEHPASFFWAAGFDVVIHANQMLRAAVRAQELLLSELADPAQPLSGIASSIVSMEAINAIVRAPGAGPADTGGPNAAEHSVRYEELAN